MAGVSFCTINPKNESVANDVADFIARGGKIHEVANGATAENKKHPFADAPEFSGKVKSSTSKGGKNAAISKRK